MQKCLVSLAAVLYDRGRAAEWELGLRSSHWSVYFNLVIVPKTEVILRHTAFVVLFVFSAR